MHPSAILRILEQVQFEGTGRAIQTDQGYLLGWGNTVPTHSNIYAPGAMFVHTDGSNAVDVLYVNAGTAANSNFLTTLPFTQASATTAACTNHNLNSGYSNTHVAEALNDLGNAVNEIRTVLSQTNLTA